MLAIASETENIGKSLNWCVWGPVICLTVGLVAFAILVLVLASVGPAVPEIWTLAWIGKKFWNLAQLRNDLFRSVSLDSHLLILLD